MKFTYQTNCTCESGESIEAMEETALDITYKTFRSKVDSDNFEAFSEMLGYVRGVRLSLKTDYHVTFHRSKFNGRLCYYVIHSCINYIFLNESC